MFNRLMTKASKTRSNNVRSTPECRATEDAVDRKWITFYIYTNLIWCVPREVFQPRVRDRAVTEVVLMNAEHHMYCDEIKIFIP